MPLPDQADQEIVLIALGARLLRSLAHFCTLTSGGMVGEAQTTQDRAKRKVKKINLSYSTAFGPTNMSLNTPPYPKGYEKLAVP